MIEVEDWSGRRVQLAESKGGVLAFVDPFAGLLRRDITPWPPPAIVQKLYKSRHEHAFTGADHKAVTSSLGFYSDLQSVHSEDAITWNVFGPVAHSPPEVRRDFVAELLEAAGLSVPHGPASISLWRRVAHPDSLVSGGPELDALIQTPHVAMFVEAKWQSSVGTHQGKHGDKDQVHLRVEFFEKYGRRVFPGVQSFVVCGASWREPIITPERSATLPSDIFLTDLTWDVLCGMATHPLRSELSRYYDWKEQYTRVA